MGNMEQGLLFNNVKLKWVIDDFSGYQSSHENAYKFMYDFHNDNLNSYSEQELLKCLKGFHFFQFWYLRNGRGGFLKNIKVSIHSRLHKHKTDYEKGNYKHSYITSNIISFFAEYQPHLIITKVLEERGFLLEDIEINYNNYIKNNLQAVIKKKKV